MARPDGSNKLTIKNEKFLPEFSSTHPKKPVPEYDPDSETQTELRRKFPRRLSYNYQKHIQHRYAQMLKEKLLYQKARASPLAKQ